MTGEILFEVRNHVGRITLNRPAALNALSLPMVGSMHEQLRVWERDASVHAVLVQGAGEKSFCAGGDIRSLRESLLAGGTMHHRFFHQEYRLDYYIHVFPKPYIAVMNGITMGGGMGISQGARHRLVGERTRIAMPETGIGLFPDVGASYFLSRLPGGLGLYLGLTGVQLRAADALYAGFADAYLSPESALGLDAAFDALRWSGAPPADVAALLKRVAGPFDAGATLPALREAIDFHFAKHDVRAILASLDAEMRPQYREWARGTAAVLDKRSPLMLEVTARQLARGRTMSLADCFRMELLMVNQSMKQHDLLEGIRAVVVDKDNAPRWRPDRLEDVTPEMVDAFFTTPWRNGEHPFADLETR